METSLAEVQRGTKRSINDISEDRDHVEEMHSNSMQQHEKKSMSIDIQ